MTVDDENAWTLRFAGNRYDLVFADGVLRNTYFGPDFAGEVAELPEHHQNWDRLRASRPEGAVRVGPRGRLVRWEAASAKSTAEGLTLVLSAPALSAELDFRIDEPTGSLLRRTVLTAAEEVEIAGALSFSATIGEPVERMSYLSGRWAAEAQPCTIVPQSTALQLESRSGKTGFEYQPYLALTTPTGTVVVELLWSGNWQINARSRQRDGIVAGGLPEHGFRHVLRRGERMELPEAILLRVPGDIDEATRRLHDLRRKLQAADDRLIPVQFNSWYPYPGNPAVGDMKALASTAVEMGCEVFVLDGGWHVNAFGPPGDDPWQSTGDWIPDPRLFPDGLEELAEHCRAIGIRFGIWFEPESIGYSSRLRTEHPEWHHWIDGRAPDPAGRAILNLGIPEARAHVRETMLDIVRRTGASWVKWDFNADLTSGGWAAGLPDELTRADPVLAHYRGLYLLQEELRAAAPELVLEMCASGGGRFDGRILRHAHTNWMSDQANPLANLAIHFGTQRAHPARLCNDWLIAWPAGAPIRHGGGPSDLRGDLAFRLRVAMLGPFGLSSKLQQWSAEEIAFARDHIAWYKAHARPVIERGDQYLLTPPPSFDGHGEWAAIWYAEKNAGGGVGYGFRLDRGAETCVLKLPGLEPESRYRVVEYGGATREATGAELAAGLPFTCPAPYSSVAFHVERG